MSIHIDLSSAGIKSPRANPFKAVIDTGYSDLVPPNSSSARQVEVAHQLDELEAGLQQIALDVYWNRSERIKQGWEDLILSGAMIHKIPSAHPDSIHNDHGAYYKTTNRSCDCKAGQLGKDCRHQKTVVAMERLFMAHR